MIKLICMIVALPMLAFGQISRVGDDVATLRFYDTTKVDDRIEKNPVIMVTDSGFEQSFWNGEAKLQLRLSTSKYPIGAEEPSILSRNGQDRVRMHTGDLTHDMYAKISKSFEWDMIFYSMPDTNVFTYEIESEGLVFTYQNEADLAPLDTVWEEEEFYLVGGSVMDSEYIGSYLIESTKRSSFQNSDGPNYGSGIIGYIYPPKAWNSKGDTAVCSLFIDQSLLKVIVPQDFLDGSKEALPITIDPEWGFNNDGSATLGEYFGTSRGIQYTTDQVTVPSDSIYTVTKLWYRGDGLDFSAWNVEMSIYDVNGSNHPQNKISQTTITGAFGGSITWESATVSIPLFPGTYTLAVGETINSEDVVARYTSTSLSGTVDLSATRLSEIWDHGSNSTQRLCIYAEYTASLPPSPDSAWIFQDTTGCDAASRDCWLTLQDAETANQKDLVATDSNMVFIIGDDTWSVTDTATLFDGWTTDQTHNIKVTAIGAARHPGYYSTTAYRASTSISNYVIRTNEDYVTFDGLQVTSTYTGGGSSFPFYISSTTGVVIEKCIVKGSSASAQYGIYSTAVELIKIRNNVVYDCSIYGIYATTNPGGIIVSNNTVENCGTGMFSGYEDATIFNNILYNNTTPLGGTYNLAAPLSSDQFTDAASISYGDCGSCGTGDEVSQSDPFENLGGEDYHLSSSIGDGTDLSYRFTDDIDDDTRSTWDKGADEFVAAVAPDFFPRRKRIIEIGEHHEKDVYLFADFGPRTYQHQRQHSK
ncbi:right-handed parallel beta-helix repeat-containing protein [Candidatus Pacearchaeota archaeon]|nr:right-handed parallel beta-helix repeat-containing protein [Candidatus Pacearchaeota archaeon]